MSVTERHFEELRHQGFTIIENVVSEEQCDIWLGEYKAWLDQFKGNKWPFTVHSPINTYNNGNLETTWKARLATKAVFSKLWSTDKLVSTIDGIVIRRPPEIDGDCFDSPGNHLLHCDQEYRKKGLHAYHGNLFVEQADDEDWTLHIMTRSHLFTDEFFETHRDAAISSHMKKYYPMTSEDMQWFKSKGCTYMRIKGPKGGMLIRDARLIHANAAPKENRKYPERWRFVLLACMIPAIWASNCDIEKIRKAYTKLAMTTHWPCKGFDMLKCQIPSSCRRNAHLIPTEHSETAKSQTAKEICGVIPYDFKDGKSNGPDWAPVWREDPMPRDTNVNRKLKLNFIGFVIIGLSLCVAFLTNIVYKYLRLYSLSAIF